MRKRSEQIHSRESSATLQLTVSLLYLNAEKNLHPADCCDTLAVKEIQERKRKWQDI